MQVHIIDVPWTDYAQRLSAIREEVFIAEQNVPREIEWDGQDEDATHFLAIDEAGRDIGCARLLPEGQIGRMAVKAPYRGKGIGGELLEGAVDHAQSLGLAEVYLHAQSHAVAFYEDHDFLPEGEEYEEAGIPHRTMRRKLAIEVPADTGRLKIVTPPEPIQQTASGTVFDEEAQATDVLVQGLDEARRHLVIYSHYLDPTYFDQPAVVDQLSAFARRSRTSEARILIHSSSVIVSRGHRLVELARRLPSKFAIRLVDGEYDPPESCFVSWDLTGYWRLADYRVPNGVMRSEDPVRARRLTENFDQLWRRGRPDPNLRVLRL